MTAILPLAIPSGLPPGAFSTTQLLSALRSVSNLTLFGTLSGASAAVTGTAYTSVTGASQSFTKTQGSSLTNVLGLIIPSAFKATATNTVSYAISDGTTDWTAVTFTYNTTAEHMQTPGGVLMTGLAAAAYTMTLRAKMATASGTLTINTDDTVSMLLMEVPV